MGQLCNRVSFEKVQRLLGEFKLKVEVNVAKRKCNVMWEQSAFGRQRREGAVVIENTQLSKFSLSFTSFVK